VITGVTSNLPSVPGQVYELPNGESYAGLGVPAAKLKGVKMLTEESIYSKWARNGVIVRKDALEQNRDPKHRCARPGCPGHKSATDRCFP
jgi:hypothetical protein